MFGFYSAMDPIYALAIPFRASELKSANKKMLVQPSSYDRTVIESMWRQCSRNRMRTNRRIPRHMSNNPISRVTAEDDLRSESDPVAPKKHVIDVSVSATSTENVILANCDGSKLLESDNRDPTGHIEYSSNTVNLSGNSFSGSVGTSELDNLSVGQPQAHSSGIQVVSVNTGQAPDGSVKVEDCWWNKVDSRTWLQGLQSYLLHSAASVEYHQLPVAILLPNATPATVIANAATVHQATPPVVVESTAAAANNLWMEHQYARPVLAPVTGYRLAANGVQTAVPICFFPVANYDVCRPDPGVSAIGCQQMSPGGQQSSLGSVDLVSFMHNYCLPPSSDTQSSNNSSTVQTIRNVSCPQLVSSAASSSNEWPGTLLTTVSAASDERSVTALSFQTENSHWRATSNSSDSEAARFLSSSNVFVMPKPLSSSSSTESSADCDDACKWTLSSSTVAVDSVESLSLKSVDAKTGSLLSVHAGLTIPGWFGKGLSMKRSKRRLSRQS